jgi:DNA-binding transcriptional ArsR family regulator
MSLEPRPPEPKGLLENVLSIERFERNSFGGSDLGAWLRLNACRPESQKFWRKALPEPIPQLIDARLVKAMAHPTRVQALTVLQERNATPAEIARTIGESLNNVCYHVGELVKLDCVEPVSVQAVQGGRVSETRYRATRVPSLDDSAWEGMSRKEQHGFLQTYLNLVSRDLADAMAAGTFHDPGDNHLSRSPMNVDPAGWKEVAELLDSTVEQLKDIQMRANQRIGPRDKSMPMKVEILQFRSPRSK